ncbi:MAG: hypothetical protein H0U49_02450 [Parachlamydiaceae bacterium]|nr:hypothetical protein [Parachlamydiaceae bacterium]
MPIDPAIHDALLKSEIRKKPTEKPPPQRGPFTAIIEKSIQQEVDLLLAEEDPTQNKLLGLQTRRTKLEHELRESLDMPDFSKHVETAINILRNEGNRYLEKDNHDLLIAGLNKLNKSISSLDPVNLNDETLNAAIKLSPQNLSSILNIGIAKYSEGLMPESLSIFAFLSALDFEEPDYWYRLGIVAQKCEQYDLALRAFAFTSMLAPDFIGTHIFAAESFLKTGKLEDAIAEVKEIKSIIETTKVDEEMQKRVVNIENLIAAALPDEEEDSKAIDEKTEKHVILIGVTYVRKN